MNKDTVLNQLIETNLLSFYGWWQLAVCLFAFVALMSIWWHIGRKLNEFGQVWLALSVLCWAFSGAIDVYYANSQQAAINEWIQSQTIISNSEQLNSAVDYQAKLATTEIFDSSIQNGWKSIFSLCNSLFILLALPYFRYIPQKIRKIIESNFWPHVVGIPFLFSLLPTITRMLTENTISLMNELDVYYGMFTIIFMGLVLFESFTKRRLAILAGLSVVCCLITLLAQVYKLTSFNVDLTLYSAIFKTSLIMIFFALALSWVKELTENIIPNSEHFSLVLSKVKNGQKYDHMVTLGGFAGKNDHAIKMTPTLFELLSRFAKRKKAGDGWLEIRPKNDVYPEKDYDIRDHNEIKRLVTALLDGYFGKGLWTKSKHEDPLRKSLFEISKTKARKIQLAIPANKIDIISL